jgi:hypothetical protein
MYTMIALYTYVDSITDEKCDPDVIIDQYKLDILG